MKIAYFVNQYPKISHSFIRREINALERQGVEVSRYALKNDPHEIVDDGDKRELSLTHTLLNKGIAKLLISALKSFISTPSKCFKAIFEAFKLGVNSERGLLRHFIYFIEACYLAEKLKADGSEHLHAHFGTNTATVAMWAARLADIKFSFTVHGPEEFDKPQFIGLPKKIRESAFTVAISSYGRSQLYRLVEYSHWDKIKEVHCGLEQDFYQGHEPKTAAGKTITCIGRICEQKGQQLLIDALSIVKEKHPDIKLILVGGGEMEAVVRERVSHYKLENNVVFAGWKSSAEIREYIENSTFTVLPSFAEGLPVVIMESMSLSTPVLSTYIAGIPELIKHGENSWLVPAGDAQQIAEQINDVFDLSDEELRKIGFAAKETVLERHNIDIEASKLRRYFEEAIDA